MLMQEICKYRRPSIRRTYAECKKKHIRCTTGTMLVCEESRVTIVVAAAIVCIVGVIVVLALV